LGASAGRFKGECTQPIGRTAWLFDEFISALLPVVEDHQIERSKLLGVGDQVDCDDPPGVVFAAAQGS
jgi:hypothetical protein